MNVFPAAYCSTVTITTQPGNQITTTSNIRSAIQTHHHLLGSNHSNTNTNGRRPLIQTNTTSNNVVSWTSSIARHCRNGMLSAAVAEFSRMRLLAGIQPNDITFVTLLSACAHFPSTSLPLGVSIHGYISKLGFHKNNVMLYTALVDMYAKCAHVESARRVFDQMSDKNSMSWNTMIDGYMRSWDFDNAVTLFDQMPLKDKITWTAMITGFVKGGLFEEALDCFRQMQLSGVQPDYVTGIAVLSACANLGLLGLGIWFHCYAIQQGICENIRVRNSLIDMYSRCGCIEFARQVFQNMDTRSIVSWNSMIVGLAVNGYAEDALEHFRLLQKAGLRPNGVSFTGALTACSHAGLIDEGIEFYRTMTKVHRISPTIEHYGCMVDILSRAGHLEDAFTVIENMPMKLNEVVLGSLLAACTTRRNFNLAERLTSYLVGAMPSSDSNYVILSNVYAAMGRWDGAGRVRRMMKARGVKKKPGFSTVEIDCSIHEFMAADKSHSHSEDIYAVLDQLFNEMRLYGYVPKTIIEDLREYG